jgi:hypothetical protein
VHNLISALCFGLCFLFGLFSEFCGWELGLGEAFFHVAWECLGYAWAMLRLPSSQLGLTFALRTIAYQVVN